MHEIAFALILVSQFVFVNSNRRLVLYTYIRHRENEIECNRYLLLWCINLILNCDLISNYLTARSIHRKILPQSFDFQTDSKKNIQCNCFHFFSRFCAHQIHFQFTFSYVDLPFSIFSSLYLEPEFLYKEIRTTNQFGYY